MSTRAILRALTVASVAVAGVACKDATEPALPEFFITPAVQWSGGTLTVRSHYFVSHFEPPIIVAGGDTLPLLSLANDSTLVAQLPPGPSASLTVSFFRGTHQDSVGTIERVGFSQKRTVTPALYGELLATDSAGTEPFVFGGSFTGTADREPIVRLRVGPGTAQALTLRQPSNTQYGMAPTATSGVFAVRDSTDSLRLALLFGGAPAVTGTVPWAGTGFTRQVSQLSAGIWLFTNAHQSYTKAEADSLQRALFNAESPWAVYLSPRGDRTTIAAVEAGGAEGVPVLDNATGTIAYRLPLVATEAAAFSADGSVLFAIGASDHSSDTLIAVDATTGTLLHPKVHLPGGMQGMGVAYRATAGGGQLLVGAATATSLALLVYRASTLELLGILPSGDACPDMQAGPCFAGVVIGDNTFDRAYVVIPGNPTPIWTFDLLP